MRPSLYALLWGILFFFAAALAFLWKSPILGWIFAGGSALFDGISIYYSTIGQHRNYKL